ncbi:STAS domain-containing protein [Krasilnikovia sp. MM14-A1259]|uniref:STAS domain-containing protein n=1 Tax=Krasilnikovia sp. MM14-A1259 TaxID=3373539 RepID=UPI0037F3D7A4
MCEERGRDGVSRLIVRGEIDQAVGPTLAARITQAASRPETTELIIDLRQVSFLAAAGITSLLEGRAAAIRHGCYYRVANAHGIVRKVLSIVELLDLLQHDDRVLPRHGARGHRRLHLDAPPSGRPQHRR